MPEVPWEDPLVQLALTHPSSVSEGSGQEDNQRLEFLGDAVLGLVIGQTLFRQLPTDQEGPLSRLRSRLVSREMLAEMGEQLNLADRLKVGHGERLIDPAARQRALTDAFEALIGALFLIWGYLPTQAWVLEVMREPVDAAVSGLDDGRDPKSMLQEALQHRGTNPMYDVLESIGPAHRRRYRVVVKAGGKVIGRGEGRTKKVAEQDAAKDALEQLAKADQPRRRRPVIKKSPSPTTLPLTPPTGEGDASPSPAPSAAEAGPSKAADGRQSRRRAKSAPAVVVLAALPGEPRTAVPGVDPAPTPAARRRRRRSAAKASGSAPAVAGPEAPTPVLTGSEAPATTALLSTPAPTKRRRRRSRAKHPAPLIVPPAALVPAVAVVIPEAPVVADAPVSASPRRRRRRRAKHAVSTVGPTPGSGFVPKSAIVPPPAQGSGTEPQVVAPNAEGQTAEVVRKKRRHRGGRRRHKTATGLPPSEPPSAPRELEEWEAERPDDD